MNISSFQTVHIIPGQNVHRQDLLKTLFSSYLQEDPLFHFFYEPDLIIRISSQQTQEKVAKFLEDSGVDFVFYDYPTPVRISGAHYYGETPDGIVIKNLNRFLPLFHQHAIAALTYSTDQHALYRSRVISILLKTGEYSLKEEVNILQTLAFYKLEKPFKMANRLEMVVETKIDDDISESVKEICLLVKNKMSKDDYFLFMERVIHTMYNMGGGSRRKEGDDLGHLAELKKKQSNSNSCTIL